MEDGLLLLHIITNIYCIYSGPIQCHVTCLFNFFILILKLHINDQHIVQNLQSLDVMLIISDNSSAKMSQNMFMFPLLTCAALKNIYVACENICEL